MDDLEETENLEAVDEEVAAMSDAELQEYNDELVKEVKDFITKNSERNADQVSRIKADRAFAGGKQWTDADKKNRGEDRLEEPINVTENIISAVVNPIKARPFRAYIEVVPKYKDVYGDAVATLNDRLLELQNSYDTASSNETATKDEATTGLGFCYATTEEKNGEIVVGYHAVIDTTKVVWDADAKDVTMKDAKQAVVIELIKVSEAEERFGTDIWGGKEPEKTTLVDLGNNFVIPEGLVPLLTYFRVEGFSCEYHRLIGEQVVESDLLEGVSRVPIVAFIGEQTWVSEDDLRFTGMVHRLRSAQRKANYANSQMMERLSMSNKVAFMGPDAAIDGYEEEWANCNYSTDAYLHYRMKDKEGNALDKPEHIDITCRVDDLQGVFSDAMQQAQYTSGVSPTGIVDQTIRDEQSATEALLRTKSNQSNVSHYLDHTKQSILAAGRLLAEMIIFVDGLDIPAGVYEVKVDGGCVELTRMEELRRCILAIMQFVPDSMKSVLSIILIETLDYDKAPAIAQMLVKLLPPELQSFMSGDNSQATVMQLQQQVTQLTQQLQQAQQQYQELNIQAQELQLRTKSDLAIKQIDAQTQLQKQKMANDNAILLKRMEIEANAQQKQFEAGVESASQDKQIVANAQSEAAKAERDLNAEIAKAEVDARLDVEKKKAEALNAVPVIPV